MHTTSVPIVPLKVNGKDFDMRKIAADKALTGRFARVYYDRLVSEYVVKFYHPSGEHVKAADYFTDSKEDAVDTMTHFIRSENESADTTDAGKDGKTLLNEAIEMLESSLYQSSYETKIISKLKHALTLL